MMKKTLCFFVAFIMVGIHITACQKGPSNGGTENNGNVFFYQNVVYGAKDDTVLLKYSVKDGYVSYVYQDPLADQTSEEQNPLYNIKDQDICSYGDMLYYIKSVNGEYGIYSYSGIQDHITKLFETKTQLHTLFYCEGHVVTQESYYNEAGILTQRYIGLKIVTGETFEIPYPSEFATLEEIKADRLVWNAYDGSRITTDVQGGDVVLNAPNAYDGYVYTLTNNPQERPMGMRNVSLTVSRTNLETGETEIVNHDVGPVCYLEDMIIYFKPVPLEEQVVIHEEDGIKSYDIFGGNVYGMKLDGSDPHLICHAEGANILGMSTHRNNALISGDWVGIQLSTYHTDEHGNDYMFMGDLLMVNVKTGEYKIGRFDPTA